MAANSEFYLARAAQSAKEASEAILDNVRDRCLRSEKAWQAMADQLLCSEASRKKQADEKATLQALA
ncbi:hypothetical protein [Novosphingobium sp. CCH12-A3]|uniref:hypothetical protein n=1 Tax=Novosphingobium sp. CCH12-A3 TaxID=1768752 RepID=UPI0007838162|nr:hypothetical protein [Novosphingobium sp. CCH12-A3]